MMILKLAWRNIWRNKRRSLITIVSILIAVFLAILMRAIQLGMYDNMIKNVVGNHTGYVQVHAKGYWDEQSINNCFQDNNSLRKTIKSVEGVVDIVPRLSNFSLGSLNNLTKGLSITGVNLEKEKLLKPMKSKLSKGKVFSKSNEILIGKEVSTYFNSSLGDTLILIGQGYHGASAAGKYIISGIVDMKNPLLNQSTVIMDIKDFQSYLDVNDFVSELIVVKEANFDERKLAKNIAMKLDMEKYEVMDWHEMQPEIDQTILVDSIGGLIMVAILYMIITFGIFGTVLMMVQERMYEIGILVSVGMKKIKMSAIIVLETLFLTIIGVLAGMIAVLPLVIYFRDNPIDLSNQGGKGIEEFGFEPIIPALLDPSIFYTHGAIILILSLIISIYPIIVIMKLDPITAMKK